MLAKETIDELGQQYVLIHLNILYQHLVFLELEQGTAGTALARAPPRSLELRGRAARRILTLREALRDEGKRRPGC